MAVTEEFRVVTVNIGERLALVAAVGDLAWPVGVPRNGPTLADLPVRKLVVRGKRELRKMVLPLDHLIKVRKRYHTSSRIRGLHQSVNHRAQLASGKADH